MKHLSPEGKLTLEDHETPRGKYNPLPYRDSKGVPTQGIGETQGVTMDSPPMSYEQAMAKFEERLARDFVPKVNELVGSAPTTQKQFDAMVILAYNIGFGPKRFDRSTVLRMHKAGKYQSAAAAFSFWNKVTSDGIHKIIDVLYPKGTLVVLDGLTTRRADEARMYRDGSAADGLGNADDAIERSTTPSEESEKPLGQTRTVAGGTVATVAASMSIYAQLTGSAKDVAINTVGIAKEFGDPTIVLGVGGAIAAIAGIGWVLYARWNDRQQGLR